MNALIQILLFLILLTALGAAITWPGTFLAITPVVVAIITLSKHKGGRR